MNRSGEYPDREGSVERLHRLHRELKVAVTAQLPTALSARLMTSLAELDRLIVFDSNEVERIAACGRAHTVLRDYHAHLRGAVRR